MSVYLLVMGRPPPLVLYSPVTTEESKRNYLNKGRYNKLPQWLPVGILVAYDNTISMNEPAESLPVVVVVVVRCMSVGV